jgi:hypothetical protein
MILVPLPCTVRFHEKYWTCIFLITAFIRISEVANVRLMNGKLLPRAFGLQGFSFRSF